MPSRNVIRRSSLASLVVAVVAFVAGCSNGPTSEGVTGLGATGSGSSQGTGSNCGGVALTLGSSVTTSLSPSSCANGTPFTDMYTLTSPSNTPLVIAANSSAFPLHLTVVNQSNRTIADTSVAAGAAGAVLRLIVPADQYRITVGSALVSSSGGVYSLTAASASEDVDDCTRVFVAPGVVTHQQLLPTDCHIGASEGDQFLLHLSAGQSVKVVWDDYLLGAVQLRVFGSDGALVSSTVSANPSTTTIAASQSGFYTLEFSYTYGGTARYEFAIQ